MSEKNMGILSILSIFATASLCIAGPDEFDVQVVGGRKAYPGEVPFVVSLREGGKHMCGGSLIGDDLVVTAAHCYDDGTELDSVLVGDVLVAGSSSDAEVFGIENKTLHEDYVETDNRTRNDIALIRLDSPFNYSESVAAIAYATSRTDDYDHCYIAGWGKYNASGTNAKYLQIAETEIVGASGCRDPDYDDATMVCAYSPRNDACQGDSGGPLYCTRSGRTELVGIVSFGIGTCTPGQDGVYTRVSAFSDWIAGNKAPIAVMSTAYILAVACFITVLI